MRPRALEASARTWTWDFRLVLHRPIETARGSTESEDCQQHNRLELAKRTNFQPHGFSTTLKPPACRPISPRTAASTKPGSMNAFITQ